MPNRMTEPCGRCGHPRDHTPEPSDAGIPSRCSDCSECTRELDDALAKPGVVIEADFSTHSLHWLRHVE
jgi:hypothetical protein